MVRGYYSEAAGLVYYAVGDGIALFMKQLNRQWEASNEFWNSDAQFMPYELGESSVGLWKMRNNRKNLGFIPEY